MGFRFSRLLFLQLALALALTGAQDTWDNTAENLPYAIDCSDPYVCTKDSKPHCTMSGRVVFGHCGLQMAICLDNEVYDPDMNCLKPQ